MGHDCVFCRIIRGDIPGDLVYEDDRVVAFRDIHPAAPSHFLIVPRKHVTDILALADDPEGPSILSALLSAAAAIARQSGIDRSGFRLINNCGRDGGQTIDHVHVHLLGGRPLGERLLHP